MIDISYQLYSSANFGPLNETIAHLSNSGFAQVEGIGANYENVDELIALLATHKLKMPSGHFDIAMLENDIGKAIDIAKRLNMTLMVCPYLEEDQRPTDKAGWLELGQRLEKICTQVNAAGLDFAWHNHEFEFISTEDGAMPIVELMNCAPDMLWEADLAWVTVAEQDPVKWLETYGNRVGSVHIKDIAPKGENLAQDGWANIGTGIMNWAELLPKAQQTNAKYFILEHDKPENDQDFARISIQNVRSMLERANG